MFSIPISITNTLFDGAMLDLGASINVLPSSLYESLKLGPLKYTRVAISLANKSNVLPLGKIEDVIVKVGDLSFPTDFYVLEMDTNDESIPIILGRPFMKSARMIIDVHMGSVSVQSGKEKLTYQVFKHTIPSIPIPSLNGITITINNDNKEPITVLGNGPMLLTMQEASSSNSIVQVNNKKKQPPTQAKCGGVVDPSPKKVNPTKKKRQHGRPPKVKQVWQVKGKKELGDIKPNN